jgi:signal peptidase I
MASEEKDLVVTNEPVGEFTVTTPESGGNHQGNAASEIAVTEKGKPATQKVVQPEGTVTTPLWLKLWHKGGENLQILVVALVLALLIRMFVAEPRFIPSASMVPTLQIGDRLVVEKISYHFRPPAMGDIVVFDPPQQLQVQGYAKDQAFIKRVIAEPGQTIQVKNGKVYVDNAPLKEDYIAEPPDYRWGPAQVPEGQLFVMGDNRNNSNDSHVWGFLPKQNIIGRAFFRFWPFDRISRV